ncbi:MAG: hypothetical protein APF80_13355 [Alphaproteobacteria bacterium BRH_c36]|nr:MAG: hypothetical protein APF80_13355 [Alphaproteobacteria bacterium BRH_c36]
MNILIADDHPLYREALASVLECLGPDTRIFQAETFDDVVDQVANRTVDLDLILLDLYMGSANWGSVIKKLRRSSPSTPIVVISGSDCRADAERVMNAGCCGFIPKSMKKDEMLSAIRLILTGGVSVQPRDLRPEERLPYPTAGRRDDLDNPLHLLTSRQRDVLAEIGAGRSNKLIARSLGMAEGTVKLHVAAILKCLGTSNRTQAAVLAHRLNLAPDMSTRE